jgi:hypothetical protein
MSPDTLFRWAPRLLPLPGVLILLVGAYAAGGVQTTCRRAGGRVDCHMRTLRIFELDEVGSQDAHDVVDAYDEASTSDSGLASQSSAVRHTTTNNTIVLETRDGSRVAAFGDTPEGSGEHVSQLRGFLRDPHRTTAYLFSSDWPFALAAIGFGAVWSLFTGFIAAAAAGEQR